MPQRQLIHDFFQIDQQRKEAEERLRLRREKAEQSTRQAFDQVETQAASQKRSATSDLQKNTRLSLDAVKAYEELKETLSEFSRPKEQLGTVYDPIERLRAMEAKLKEADANLKLGTTEGYGKAYACASDVQKLGAEIHQRIEEYHLAKSEASSAIEKIKSEFSGFFNHSDFSRLGGLEAMDLRAVRNTINQATQQLQSETLVGYRKVIETAKSVSDEIRELESLAAKRKRKYEKETEAIPGAIWKGLGHAVGWAIVGAIGGATAVGGIGGAILDASYEETGVGAGVGAVIGAVLGFILGYKSKMDEATKDL